MQSNLTVFIKEEHQRQPRQMIVVRDNQLVRCLRVRQGEEEKKKHWIVVHSTEDNLGLKYYG